MRKVCEVYLISSSATDERGVELTFPVSQYDMMDTLEHIQTKYTGDVYWQMDEFYCFDYLAPHLDENMSIFEFNSLTEQLSKLDSYQETALEGLLQMQVKNHMQENSGIITVPELMMLAANVNRCHVLADIHTDEDLGKFYVKNGFREDLDALPERKLSAEPAKLSTTEVKPVENEDTFLRKLNAGEKVIAIELDSPRNADLTGYLEGARKLQAAGADLLTIADCPIAQARMDSSLVACRVHRELGMCTLPHMTCRDRNLNATKALLLGLYAEGVREVLAITGDPIPTAERDEVKNVYQFNSRKLAQYIVSLAGEDREMPTPMTVFGALNLNARNFDVELRRAGEKLENGMSGFLTQPVLSEQAVENLRRTRETLGSRAKILAGIMPVVSQRNAIFMENEINGIHVDEELIQKFAGLDRAGGEELGLAISLEMARKALPYADGFYLMTPFNRVALMERLIAQLRTEVLQES